MKTQFVSLLWVSALALSCGPQSASSSTEVADDTLEGELSSREWRVRTEAMTVWFDETLTRTQYLGSDFYVLTGRTSRNLESVFSFVPDDPVGEAQLSGPRSFRIVLGAGELRLLLAGREFMVALTPKSGDVKRYTAGLRLCAQVNSAGTSSLYVSKNVKPVWVAGEIRFRGHLSASSSTFRLEEVQSAAPASVSQSGPRSWRYEWRNVDDFPVASAEGQRVLFMVRSSAGPLAKKAELSFNVSSLRLTTKEVYDVWKPAPCSERVKRCLEALGPGVVDTEACGLAYEVLRCPTSLPRPAVNGLSAATFASDLKTHLVTWYADHGADVTGAGGNTLSQALAAVSASKARELTSSEDDPFAHDFAQFRVFSHPDMTHPGSDIVWFGAYERVSGKLVEIYDFN